MRPHSVKELSSTHNVWSVAGVSAPEASQSPSADREKSAFHKGIGFAALATLGVGGMSWYLLRLWDKKHAGRAEATPTPAVAGAASVETPAPAPESAPVLPEFVVANEADGDAGMAANDVDEAMRSFDNALYDIFNSHAMNQWRRSVKDNPDTLMPFATDVLRIRTKLADAAVAMVKKVNTDEAYWLDSGGFAYALGRLGPDLIWSTAEQCIAVASDPDQLGSVIDALADIPHLDVLDVPEWLLIHGTDSAQKAYAVNQITLLLKATEKLEATLNLDSSYTDIADLAARYDRLSELVDDFNTQWKDGPPLSPTRSEMTLRAISHYLDAIDIASLDEKDTSLYHANILELLSDLNPEEQAILAPALHLAYDDPSKPHAEWANWTRNLFLGLNADAPIDARRVDLALDAGALLFLSDNQKAVADVFKALFRDTSVARALEPVAVGGRDGTPVNMVDAALQALGVDLENTELTFDELQLQMARRIDQAIRTAMREAQPGRRPYLPRDLSLSARVPFDVQLSAALEEVIRRDGEAPGAIDAAVKLLMQDERLQAADAHQLRQALRGEAVGGIVSDALKDLIPSHLKRTWQGYLADKGEAAKSEGAQAEDRSGERPTEASVAP